MNGSILSAKMFLSSKTTKYLPLENFRLYGTCNRYDVTLTFGSMNQTVNSTKSNRHVTTLDSTHLV